MEPVHYLRVVKRRWRLIAVLTLLGVVAGLVSWYLSSDRDDQTDFYAATHTLIDDDQADQPGDNGGGGGNNNNRSGLNFEQVCYLARAGEVPERAGEALDEEPDQLARRVACTPNQNLGIIEVTATGVEASRVEEIADVYAQTLLSYLAQSAQDQRDREIATAQGRVDRLRARYDELTAQLDGGADATLVGPQRDEVSSQLGAEQTTLDQLLSQPPPEVPLSTSESASAVQLTRAQYQARLDELATEDRDGNPSDIQSARDAQLEAARAGGEDDGPGPLVRAGLGGGLGFVVAIVLVLLLDRLDPRVRSRDDVEDAYDLPVLAEVPALTRAQQRTGGIVSWDQPRSRIAESYRSLRSALLFASADLPRPALARSGDEGGVGATDDDPSDGGPSNGASTGDSSSNGSPGARRPGTVLLISSPGPSEGKTTVTANLAAVFAETGSSVLVVNCDYRRPRIHNHFHADFEPRQVLPTQIPDVRIVADVVEDAEHANPADVISAQRHVIETAREMVDVVLLDTAPLLTTNDASELLDLADLVLMVAQAGRTTHEAAFRAGELLQRRHANAVGAVLLRAEAGPASRYYYYYRGRYYHEQRDRGAAEPRPRDDEASAAVAATDGRRER